MANATGNQEIKGVTLLLVALLCAGAFALAINMNRRLEHTQAELQALRDRPSDAERVELMRQQKAAAEKAQDELRAGLEAAEGKLGILEKRLELLENSAEPRRKLVDKLKADLTRQEALSQQKLAALKSLTDKAIAQLQAQTQQLTAERDQLKQRVGELEGQLSETQAQLKAAGAAKEQAKALEAKLADAKTNAQATEAKMTALAKQAHDAQTASVQRIVELTAANKKLDDERLQLAVRLKALEAAAKQKAAPDTKPEATPAEGK